MLLPQDTEFTSPPPLPHFSVVVHKVRGVYITATYSRRVSMNVTMNTITAPPRVYLKECWQISARRERATIRDVLDTSKDLPAIPETTRRMRPASGVRVDERARPARGRGFVRNGNLLFEPYPAPPHPPRVRALMFPRAPLSPGTVHLLQHLQPCRHRRLRRRLTSLRRRDWVTGATLRRLPRRPRRGGGCDIGSTSPPLHSTCSSFPPRGRYIYPDTAARRHAAYTACQSASLCRRSKGV
jgi:hypothetical protein